MTTANRLALAAALGAFGLAACTDWAGYDIDVASGKVPQLANMRRSVIPDPYAMPRLPAPNAVPSESPLGATPAHFTSEKLDSVAATLRNPYSGGAPAPVVARGQMVFQNNCYVCHGPEGAGNGPVVQPAQANGQNYARFPGAPAINGQITAAKADGYIYAVVAAGRGLMPPYGPRLTEADRWAVVEYVRALQARAGQAPQRAGAAPAGSAGVTGAPNPGTTAAPAGPTPATAPVTAPPSATPAANPTVPAPAPAPAAP